MNDCIQQMDTSIQGNSVLLQGMNTTVHNMDTSVQGMNTLVHNMGTSVQGNSVLLQGINTAVLRMDTTLQALLQRVASCQHYYMPGPSLLSVKPYKLGQSIFHLHHQFDLRSVFSGEWIGAVTGGVMMDDGRLVLCLPYMYRLLICNTDGSQTDSIPLQYDPWYVTAVNNSTVAVINGNCDIEMYDINNKHELKSILLPGVCCGGISTINNKLVVHFDGQFSILDHQTGEVVQIIKTKEECRHCYCLHATSDKIFYCDDASHNLYCYSYTDDKHFATSLPFRPRKITSLQDGSLYVVYGDGSVQHLSSDGKHYKTVTTKGLTSVVGCRVISYNQKQRKLVTCTEDGSVKVHYNGQQ